jgi:hypothetical protein
MTENDPITESAQHEQMAPTPLKPTLSIQSSSSAPGPRSPAPRSQKSSLRSPAHINFPQEGEDTGWGSNFWVTLVDPQVRLILVQATKGVLKGSCHQSQTAFFACPATGEVSWEPPVGTFV